LDNVNTQVKILGYFNRKTVYYAPRAGNRWSLPAHAQTCMTAVFLAYECSSYGLSLLLCLQ